MQTITQNKRVLALLLAMCMALGLLTGCAGKDNGDGSQKAVTQKTVTLQVVHKDGSTKDFEIKTDKETLGEALLDEGLIEGEEGQYGLFVKTVDGETVDEGNQEWWCLTKGGETWSNGVDSTEIADGDAYEFTLTVGY